METMNIFSERQKDTSENKPNLLIYDDIPKELRVQIIFIWHETLGSLENYFSYASNVFKTYEFIVKTLRKAHGKYKNLVHENFHFGAIQENYIEELEEFLLTEKNINKVLDAVEITFQIINTYTRDSGYLFKHDAFERASEAIEELNMRFKRLNIGYQFENNQILKTNSIFTHENVVKPTLKLLQDPKFAGAEEEFLKAHTHYRNNNLKESINECLKAFESTMKIICEDLDWEFSENATAKKLIEICFKNELIPGYWQSHFSSLRSLLESGVPTVRNRESGHGQGSEIKEVPEYLTASILNMTATSILFLVGAATDFKNKIISTI